MALEARWGLWRHRFKGVLESITVLKGEWDESELRRIYDKEDGDGRDEVG